MPSNLWSSLAWFVVIVAAIPAALWLLKRSPLGGGAGGQAAGVMRSVAALPLSTTQRIVTVEVGHGAARRWLVLGVTPQSITTLHTLEPQDDAVAPGAEAPALPAAFAQVLGRLRRPPGTDEPGTPR